MSYEIPTTQRAIVFTSGQSPVYKEVKTPEALQGGVIVKVLSASVAHAFARIGSGGQLAGLTQASSYTPGNTAIARIVAISTDTTSLAVGQLVLVDSFVRGRDNPNVQFLLGFGVFGDDPAAVKFMNSTWTDGFYAEYAKAPLENVYALNEKLLLGTPAEGGLGYSLSDLTIMPGYAIPYGGLRSIGLTAGETVIVAPATGFFTGLAVDVASAMGARVIAMGRNLETLERLKTANPKLNLHQTKGDFQDDLVALKNFGPIDAYIDISPPQANDSTHIRSCLFALKQYGRASLMGAIHKDISIPYVVAMHNNLTIRGQYMYEREDVRGIIKLVESGALKLGKAAGHEMVEYRLEEWAKAMETVAKNQGAGKFVAFKP